MQLASERASFCRREVTARLRRYVINAFDFHRRRCLISISWKPIAYRVVQAPTRSEWLDHIWSSALFLMGPRLKSLEAASRNDPSTSADVILYVAPDSLR